MTNKEKKDFEIYCASIAQKLRQFADNLEQLPSELIKQCWGDKNEWYFVSPSKARSRLNRDSLNISDDLVKLRKSIYRLN